VLRSIGQNPTEDEILNLVSNRQVVMGKKK